MPQSRATAQLKQVDQLTSADFILSKSGLSEELRPADSTRFSPVTSMAEQLADLYQSRQAELAEKESLTSRLSTLLKALPAGVVVLDARGLVQECNPAAVDLLGEPLTGARWVDVIGRSFSPRADDGHEVSLKDGRRLSIQTRSLDNGYGQLIFLSDLTETRVLQEALARNQRLSAMGKTVASLAHQIRTPLSAAMLFADHLCTPDISPQLRINCAQKLVSRLEHLEQQVRDMLLFAKGDAPVAENMPVCHLLQEIQIAAEGISASKQVALEWQIPCVDAELTGNKDALTGAVMNLINNAIEACKQQPQPQVKVALRMGQNNLAVVVTDNGAGFDPVTGVKLMEAFYTTKSNGTGLGLAVVQSVAKAHQGCFLLTSQGEGHGAEAVFSLPLRLGAKQLHAINKENK